MKTNQKSIGREAAIAMAESGWWKDKTPREIAEFQLNTQELCLPFSEYQKALTAALGRGIYSHELIYSDRLLDELHGKIPTPTLDKIFDGIENLINGKK